MAIGEIVSESRAGRFIQQPPGYSAFVPSSLEPGMLEADEELIRLLSDADRALGRLDGAAAILPNPDLFVAMYSLKEALLSSQIEGTQASLIDVLQYEAEAEENGNGRPTRERNDIQEVQNHQKAIHYGLERVDELPISKRLMREIHEVLMQDVRGERRRPGEFREHQNWIGPPGSSIKEATFVPPPVDEMEDALDDLERYIQEDDQTPALVKSGLVHFQFETIHPFEDGNGRMGRLLITFLLAKRGVLERPLLYLSVYLNENRQDYYELLNYVRDSGDYEAWIRFFLRGVRDVSQEATETARAILQMREKHLDRVRAEVSSPHAPRLLDFLMDMPAVTANVASQQLDVAYPTANRIIGSLVDIDILEEITGRKRNRVFLYAPYVEQLGGRFEPGGAGKIAATPGAGEGDGLGTETSQ